jgi:hypothetical protein
VFLRHRLRKLTITSHRSRSWRLLDDGDIDDPVAWFGGIVGCRDLLLALISPTRGHARGRHAGGDECIADRVGPPL